MKKKVLLSTLPVLMAMTANAVLPMQQIMPVFAEETVEETRPKGPQPSGIITPIRELTEEDRRLLGYYAPGDYTDGILVYRDHSTNNKNGVEVCSFLGSGTEYLEIPEQVALEGEESKAVISVRSGAFQNNLTVKSVKFPCLMDSIGYNAFYGCANLKSVAFPDYDPGGSPVDYNEYGITLESHCFANCGLEQVTLTEAIREAGYSFVDNQDLKSVSINCRNQGSNHGYLYNAFENCKNLESAEINTAYWMNETFKNCEKLQNVTFTNRVKEISDYEFFNCYSLTDIQLPDSLTSIDKFAFAHCYSLGSITIPEKVATIDDFAFFDSNIGETVIIPAATYKLGKSAFYTEDYPLKTMILNSSVIWDKYWGYQEEHPEYKVVVKEDVAIYGAYESPYSAMYGEEGDNVSQYIGIPVIENAVRPSDRTYFVKVASPGEISLNIQNYHGDVLTVPNSLELFLDGVTLGRVEKQSEYPVGNLTFGTYELKLVQDDLLEYTIELQVGNINEWETYEFPQTTWRLGNEPKYLGDCYPRYGQVRFFFSDHEDGEYMSGLPSKPGTYWLKAKVEGSETYTGLDGDPVEITVTPAFNKVYNDWISWDIQIQGWKEGETPNQPSGAVSKYGAPVYRYTRDGYQDNSEAVPTAPGKYWVSAYVPGTDEYEELDAYQATPFYIERSDGKLINEWYSDGIYPGLPGTFNREELVNYSFYTPLYGEAYNMFSLNEEGPYSKEVPENGSVIWVKVNVDETDEYTGLSRSPIQVNVFDDKPGPNTPSSPHENCWESYEITQTEWHVGDEPGSFGDVRAWRGEPIFLFSSEKDGEYKRTYPSIPGNYWMKAIVEEREERWDGLDGEPIEITVTDPLGKLHNTWISEDIIIENWTAGDNPSEPSGAIAKYGDVVYKYSNDRNGGFKEEVPTTPGKYYVKAYPVVSELYEEIYPTGYSTFYIFDPDGKRINEWIDKPGFGKDFESEDEVFSFEFRESRYGYPYVVVSDTKDGEYKREFTTHGLGTYWAKVIVDGTEDYTGLESAPFEIYVSGSRTPENPDIPDTPVNPDLPSQPENPDQPTQPEEPVQLKENLWKKDELKIADWKFGQNYSEPSGCEAEHGEVQYQFSAKKNGGYSATVPSNAGTYWVRAYVPGDSEYKDLWGTPVSFKILPAETIQPSQPSTPTNVNGWLAYDLSIDNWKYGNTPSSPSGCVSIYGDVVYQYSANRNGNYSTTRPVQPGTYWVKATVPADTGYTALSGQPISFTIYAKNAGTSSGNSGNSGSASGGGGSSSGGSQSGTSGSGSSGGSLPTSPSGTQSGSSTSAGGSSTPDSGNQNGWKTENGKKVWYENGKKVTSKIITEGTVKYLLDSSGSPVQGWSKFNNSWYYGQNDGALITDSGIKTLTWDGKQGNYAFDSNGKMKVSSWVQKPNGKWCYFDNSGLGAQSAWKKLNNIWYYFDGSCEMMTGEQTIRYNGVDTRYAFDENGKMLLSKWKQNSSGKWNYYDKSGAGVNGWKYLKSWKQNDGTSHWYYFVNNDMVTNTTVEGYAINRDGEWDE